MLEFLFVQLVVTSQFSQGLYLVWDPRDRSIFHSGSIRGCYNPCCPDETARRQPLPCKCKSRYEGTWSTNEGPRRRFAGIGVSSLFVHGRVAPRHNRRRSYRYLTLYGTTLKVSKRADTSGRITYTSALASRMHVSSARLPAYRSYPSTL